MSGARQQAQLDVPPERLWELLGDPNRHPEWWPRVIEVDCDKPEEGCTYRQLVQGPIGKDEMKLCLETADEPRELTIRCVNTGTYAHWILTSAQEGTFVDAEFGMDPKNLGHRVFSATYAPRYFRKWLEASLEALEQAARR